MTAEGSDHTDLVDAVERARATIEKLERSRPSPKRDCALELLRAQLARATLQLDQIDPRRPRAT